MGLEKIGELRKAKKMTLEELSVKSGVPTSTLKKISAGITTNPNLDTVQAIAKALDCSLDDFDDNPKNECNTFLFKEEKILINKYRSLDDHGKKTVDIILNSEYDRIKNENKSEEISEELFPYDEPKLTVEDETELELIRQEMLAEKRGKTSSDFTSKKEA